MKTKIILLFLFISTMAFSQVYVNKTATGTDDGSSWANAYPELSDAMAAHSGVAFWVAQGTYVPATSSTDQRNADFRLHQDDEIYGGFSGNGTETLLTERDPSMYITILSGDLNGDDNATITNTETTRQDNSYHVLRVFDTAQNIIVDGFTITGGNANNTLLNGCGATGRNDRRKGAAIMVQPEENGRIYMTVNNCILEKNTATDTSVYAAFNGCGQNNIISDVDFTNCIVRNNHSDTNGAFTLVGATNHTQRSRGSITNSVFYNNTSVSGASCLKVINSTGGSSSGTDMEVINSTFANNTGFNGNVMHIQRAATTDIRNSIIWANSAGSALNISDGSPQIVNTIVTAGLGGGLNTDPLFIDTANNDFQIPLTSPAFNTGNNAYIPAGITTDILGENRIFTGTVDMGAYEYTCTSCITLNTTVVGNGNVSGAGVYVATDVVSITATADAGWMFSGWSGDLSGSTNPTSVTMATSKNITATFIEIPTFVDIDATGANDGSSWINAYTDLKVAITNTTAAKEIWIAEGVYIPSGTTRTAAFDIQKQLFIYGGFSGTETAKSQRSGGATILSGDRNGNDNAILTDTEPTRQDNSYHVFMVRRHINTAGILDRVTISGGNSNGTGNALKGAAIYANPFAATHRVKWKFINCIIEKNTSIERGAVFAMYTGSGVLDVRSYIDFENSTIRDNYSKTLENIFYSGSSGYNIYGYGSLVNCLLYNNKTDGANKASVLRINGNGSNVSVINSTFANNTSPNHYAINSNMTGSAAATIKNNIIYNNGSALPFLLSGNSPTFSNNIVEGGQLGNTNADPLFTDATSNDFTLQAGSPAIDTGDNSFITGFTTDILGQTRINNTTVDLGCFEYDASLRMLSLNKVGNGTLSPLVGTHSLATSSNITITATASPGWTFNGWTGTTTEANASFSIVLNSNMTYTAHFTENPIVYVDIDATGTGDGSSWANAYTDLKAAITLANNSTAITEVWIAEGVYTPHLSNRGDYFYINKDNLILYGGFDGTETQLSERDLTANHDTILSGDLSNNDVAVGFITSSRTDNSYNVMKVVANGVVLDGLHIEDGQATHQTTTDRQSGGAVFIIGSVNEITFKNCQFNNNVGNKGGTISAKYTTNAILNIENCVFNNNISLYGSGVYMIVDGAYTIAVNVTNTLFSNNKTEDYIIGGGTYRGYTGSAMWLRANATSSNVTTNITNCTFVGNRDNGTSSGSDRGSLALGRRNDGTSTHNVTINNSIFYNNNRSGVTTLAINQGHTNPPTTILVNNSIDEDNFSNIPAGYKVATSNADPLFTSTTDFTVQTGSPAINSGDNTKVPASITTDLAGNNRIQDTTVDMGCYESTPLVTYTLTTTVTGTGSVTPSGTSTHNDGAVVVVTATPATGWVFSNWTGDASGSTNPLSVTMSANKSIEAVFTQIQRTLITTVTGSGSVTPSGTSTHNDGAVVSITATASAGYVFSNWTGDASGSTNPLSVTMSANKSIEAVFTQIQRTLTTTVTGTGSVSPSGTSTHNDGAVVSITATATTGWEFSHWTGDASGSVNPLSVTMSANKSIDAVFTQIQHELTISATNGAATPDSGTLVGGSYTYNYGTSVIVTATANSGYVFDHFEVTDNTTSTTTNSTSNPVTVTMDDSYTVEAVFTQIQRTLTTTVTGSGSVSPSGTSTHNDGAVVSITATATTGWEFSHWTGDASGSVNPLSITMSANKSIEAVFTQIQYELTIVSVNGSTTPDSGTLSGGTYIYNSGTSVIVTTTANSGYYFDHFEVTDNTTGTTTNSTSNPVTITMDDSYTVVAIFAQIQRTLTTTVTGSGSVTPSGTSTHNDGAVVSITATASAGYVFSNWTGDASGSTNPLSVTMSADKSIEAVFTQIQRTLITTVTGTGSVTPSGTSTHNNGATVAITATAVTGWEFSHWTGDASGSVNPLSVTMSANMSIEAVFTQIQYELTISATNGAATPDSGTLVGGSYTYNSGTAVIVTATANSGYYFDHYEITDITTSTTTNSTSNPVTVNMDDSYTVVVVFTQTPTYTLTTTVTGTGSVSPSGSTSHSDGSVVSVTATAGTGWEFSHWTGDASGSVNPLSVTMNANMSVEAVFTQIQHELTIVSTNGTATPDSGTLSGSVYTYNYGTSVIVTATADSGYVFDHYEVTDTTTGTTVNSTTNPVTVNMSDSYTVEAIYTSTANVEDVVNASFNLYPNPVKDVLHITLDADIENVEVFNLLGRKVLESTSKELNVSNLEVGIYMVRVKTTSNLLVTKKFIKK